MAGRHRQLGLDDPKRLDEGLDLLSNLLQDRHFRTRPEIGEAFVERGSAIRPGEQLGHLLMVAELHGLVCSGPVKGVHHSYALVDEVVPPAPSLDQDEAHRELVRRFFAGHGPATVKDFTRWSSLTVAGTRTALGELGDTLEQVEVDGTPHWFDPAAVPRRSPAAPAAYLLPTYDEVVLSYPVGELPCGCRTTPTPSTPTRSGPRSSSTRRTSGSGSARSGVTRSRSTSGSPTASTRAGAPRSARRRNGWRTSWARSSSSRSQRANYTVGLQGSA